jgi:hypothetical protein
LAPSETTQRRMPASPSPSLVTPTSRSSWIGPTEEGDIRAVPLGLGRGELGAQHPDHACRGTQSSAMDPTLPIIRRAYAGAPSLSIKAPCLLQPFRWSNQRAAGDHPARRKRSAR